MNTRRIVGLVLMPLFLLATGWCTRRIIAHAQETAPTKQLDFVTEDRQIAGLNVSIWKPGHFEGNLPLVIFPHGFRGSSKQSTFLMIAMAVHGYMVVAPNHKDSTMDQTGKVAPEESFGKSTDWTQYTYKDRFEDITALIAALKKDPSMPIDWSEVALAGHSLGGYTVLGMAGAWPSWTTPGIKAVLALSPYCAPYVDQRTLSGIKVPVMYEGGTFDVGVTPSVKKPGGAYDQTPSPAYFVEFDGAGHLAWTNLRPKFRHEIEFYSIEFLNKYVKRAETEDFTVKEDGVSDLRFK